MFKYYIYIGVVVDLHCLLVWLRRPPKEQESEICNFTIYTLNIHEHSMWSKKKMSQTLRRHSTHYDVTIVTTTQHSLRRILIRRTEVILLYDEMIGNVISTQIYISIQLFLLLYYFLNTFITSTYTYMHLRHLKTQRADSNYCHTTTPATTTCRVLFF